jgi:RNA polymerase subunit RPABC4/transcription elongation factor Spt4
MISDPNAINNFLLILATWGSVFLIALWLSLVIWTYRDIRKRSQNIIPIVFAVLMVMVLFLPGIVIYLILRPSHTLEDEYQQSLEEEALLQTIEDSLICPGCGRRINDNWVVCPSCQIKLKKTCRECGKLMELPWRICPYCGTLEPGMHRENITMDEALRPPPNNYNEEGHVFKDFD